MSLKCIIGVKYMTKGVVFKPLPFSEIKNDINFDNL